MENSKTYCESCISIIIINNSLHAYDLYNINIFKSSESDSYMFLENIELMQY